MKGGRRGYVLDVYAHELREHLVEDDMMSAEEDAFMQGYEEEILREEEHFWGLGE